MRLALSVMIGWLTEHLTNDALEESDHLRHSK